MEKRRINNDVLELYDSENNVVLSISIKNIDEMLNIKLFGQIITEVAHDFEDELMAGITVCKKISIDFENVTHISSMGLNTLLSLQKILDEDSDSDFKIYNVNNEVFEEFKAVGFDDLFIIERLNA